jgi:hypothetical protein
MRIRTRPRPMFRRRLLLCPMRIGNAWHWLEMMRFRFMGLYTAVMTEEEYQQSEWKSLDDKRMAEYESGE